MRQTLTRAFVALALAAVIARPAYAANKEHQQLMADIRMLQEQAQQLQNLIGSLNATLGEALRAVNARLDEQTNTTRKAFADQKLVIDALTSDLRVVREKVDDNNVRIGSMSQEVDALRQSLQQQNAARSSSSSIRVAGDERAATLRWSPCDIRRSRRRHKNPVSRHQRRGVEARRFQSRHDLILIQWRAGDWGARRRCAFSRSPGGEAGRGHSRQLAAALPGGAQKLRRRRAGRRRIRRRRAGSG